MVKLRPHGCTEAPLEPPEAPPGHAGFRRERGDRDEDADTQSDTAVILLEKKSRFACAKLIDSEHFKVCLSPCSRSDADTPPPRSSSSADVSDEPELAWTLTPASF